MSSSVGGGDGGESSTPAIEMLKEMFPDVPDKILSAFYAASGNDVEKTAEKLLAVMQAAMEKQRKAEEGQRGRDTRSYVVPAKEYGGKCNYCNVSKTGRISYGMQANKMTVQDYQDLIDRGWRRSGNWLYVPSNKNRECCCKQYTIRLDVDKFIANKSQTKTRKKVEKFIRTGAPLPHPSTTKTDKKDKKNKNDKDNKNKNTDTNKNKTTAKKNEPTASSTKQPPVQQPKRQKQAENEPTKTNNSAKEDLVSKALEKIVSGLRSSYPSIPVSAKLPVIVKSNPPKLASRGSLSTNVATVMAGLATEKLQLEKGKQATPEQKAESQRKRHELAKEIANRIQQELPKEFGAKVFEEDAFINFTFPDDESAKPTSSEQSTNSTTTTTTQSTSTTQPTSETATTKDAKGHEQTSSSSSSSSSTFSTSTSSTSATKSHDWKVVMVPAQFIKEEYELYKKYQVSVHHDKPDKHTEEGYTNFLVVSPLVPQKVDGLEHGYGSFHMQYRLNDKLIAVGVVDVLPSCLSSVYFFYDPDCNALSLGVYSALNEIKWVQEVRVNVPNLHYYYMGFYIHTCPKMKYKGDYHPSDLLCASSYQWVPLDACIPLLDATKAYTPFIADKSKHQNTSTDQALQIIERIPMQVQGQIINLEQLTTKGKQIMQPLLLTYLDRVGPEIATRMVFVVQ